MCTVMRLIQTVLRHGCHLVFVFNSHSSSNIKWNLHDSRARQPITVWSGLITVINAGCMLLLSHGQNLFSCVITLFTRYCSNISSPFLSVSFFFASCEISKKKITVKTVLHFFYSTTKSDFKSWSKICWLKSLHI